MEVRIDQISENPYNTREDLGDLEGLKNQISRFGMLTPLPVRKTEEGYELAFGSRRLAVLKKLGKTEAEVSVHDFSNKDMIALSIGENIHRKDLSPIEQARAYEKGVKVIGSVEELSQSINVSTSNIHRYLNILKLPNRILKQEKELGVTRLYEISRLIGYSKGILVLIETLIENKDINAELLKEIITGCKIICDSNLPIKTKEDLCAKILFEDYSKLAPREYSHAVKFSEGLLEGAIGEYTKKLQRTKGGRQALKTWLSAHKPPKRVSQVVDYDLELREITEETRDLALHVRKAHTNHYYIRTSVSSKNYFKRWVKKLFNGLEELVKDEKVVT